MQLLLSESFPSLLGSQRLSEFLVVCNTDTSWFKLIYQNNTELLTGWLWNWRTRIGAKYPESCHKWRCYSHCPCQVLYSAIYTAEYLLHMQVGENISFTSVMETWSCCNSRHLCRGSQTCCCFVSVALDLISRVGASDWWILDLVFKLLARDSGKGNIWHFSFYSGKWACLPWRFIRQAVLHKGKRFKW
jgi:hypothetical protein